MKTGLILIASSVGVGFLSLFLTAMTVMGNGKNPVANTIMYGGGALTALLMLGGIVFIVRSLI